MNDHLPGSPANREPRTANREPRTAAAWLLCALIVHILVRLRVTGRARLPQGPVVYVCNHRSWLDPLALIVALGPRRPVVFLAAREHVEKRRLLNWPLTRLGIVVKVDRAARDQRDTLRAAQHVIASGASLALFPEGKINTTADQLLELEPGAAVIARRADVPILPFAIAGTRELHLRRTVLLAAGNPISPGRTHRDDDVTTAQLHDTLAALIPPTPPLRRWRAGRWLGRLS